MHAEEDNRGFSSGLSKTLTRSFLAACGMMKQRTALLRTVSHTMIETTTTFHLKLLCVALLRTVSHTMIETTTTFHLKFTMCSNKEG
jgi:hypothetical protein